MKVRIDSDEWYPVHSVQDDCGEYVEVDEVTVERWRQIQRDFYQAQAEMERALKVAARLEARLERQREMEPE